MHVFPVSAGKKIEALVIQRELTTSETVMTESTATITSDRKFASIKAAGSDLVDGQEREENHEEGNWQCADGEKHKVAQVDPPLNICAGARRRERSTINHPRLPVANLRTG
ncbi:hypothetical protein PSTG_02991 [Puccinia striiformis f. sp. tritici PST-78]|uniref:Uncharacterized protein n=1 Tax=Puccinia striiformis f. sp. tritici PST-78 TaxID=1165861 RepID=A0A0L0VY03_9BASI|nr:hypothetical protein PSTG_02991 [Puccinia striiformis f. sp. tritici PST-78]